MVFVGVIAGSIVALFVLNSSLLFIGVLVTGALGGLALRGKRDARPVARGLAVTVLGVLLVCLAVWILFLQTRI